MNTVSFESSRNDVPPCLKDELCANTTSRIFPRSLDRAINRVIDIDVISITDTQYDPARRFHENRCFTVLFYYFLYWLRNFCRFTIERAWLWFVLRPDNLGGLDVVSFFRTLTLKKEKWEWWDLIVAEKGFVLLISSNFTPRNLHTKVKLSKGRENWSKANKEWETVEIFFTG